MTFDFATALGELGVDRYRNPRWGRPKSANSAPTSSIAHRSLG
jgi:hypothetical protein